MTNQLDKDQCEKLNEDQCKEFYNTSLKYLEKIAEIKGLSIKELEKYFTPDHCVKEMERIFSVEFNGGDDIRFITCRLFYSMQNTGYRNFVKLKKHAKTYRDILCDFNPKDFTEKHKKKNHFLKEALSKEKELAIIKNNKKAFSAFFDGVYDAMLLMSEFSSTKNFLNEVVKDNPKNPEVDIINYLLNKKRKPKGLGEAVTYDFIKEAGLADCGKPDVHILDVLQGIGAISENRNLAEANKTLKEIAKANEIKVYKLDKIIWLICTKNFYLDEIGDDKSNYIDMLNDAIA